MIFPAAWWSPSAYLNMGIDSLPLLCGPRATMCSLPFISWPMKLFNKCGPDLFDGNDLEMVMTDPDVIEAASNAIINSLGDRAHIQKMIDAMDGSDENCPINAAVGAELKALLENNEDLKRDVIQAMMDETDCHIYIMTAEFGKTHDDSPLDDLAIKAARAVNCYGADEVGWCEQTHVPRNV